MLEEARHSTSSREYRGSRKTWLDAFRKYEFPVEIRQAEPVKPRQADERARA